MAFITSNSLNLQVRSDWVVKLCLTMLIAKIAVLCVLAVNTRFVMDEFWHFAQANYVFNGFFDTIWPKKAVGYAAYYKLAHVIGWDAQSMLITGRLLNVALTVLLLVVVAATVRAIGWSRLQTVIAVLLLLCFSTFIERTFRLRSEPLAILFAATAVLLVLRNVSDRAWPLLIAGLFCGLAFVTTQKSVYFNIALGAGLVIDALMMRSLRRALVRSVLLLTGWAGGVLGYGFMFGGLSPMPVLHVLFSGPLELALNGGNYYTGLQDYTWQTLLRNTVPYTLCFVGILLVLPRFPHLGQAARIHLVNTLVISALVFTHNQPWPYIFTMALPFLVAYAPAVVQRLNGNLILCAILLVAVFAMSLMRNVNYLQHGNHSQLRVLSQAEALLNAGDSYFDGIGMVPSRQMSPRIWLDAQGIDRVLTAGQNSDVLHSLQEDPPDLIIESYRTTSLAPALQGFISGSYVRVADNILIQGAALVPSGTTAFTVLQSNEYTAVHRDTGEPLQILLIDGMSVTLPVMLDPGTYQITANQAGSDILVIPSNKALPILPSTPQRTPLFSGIYRF